MWGCQPEARKAGWRLEPGKGKGVGLPAGAPRGEVGLEGSGGAPGACLLRARDAMLGEPGATGPLGRHTGRWGQSLLIDGIGS